MSAEYLVSRMLRIFELWRLRQRIRRLEYELDLAARRLDFVTNWLETSHADAPQKYERSIAYGRSYARIAHKAAGGK